MWYDMPIFAARWHMNDHHQIAAQFAISSCNASTSCEILVKIGAVTSEFKRAKNEYLLRLGCNLTIIVHLARWRSETDWNIKILIPAGLLAIISVHLVKIW